MKKMVIKRNGTKVPYEKEKVYNALTKAFIEVDGQIYEDETINEIVNTVTNFIKTEKSVEEIQDLIEDELMASERKDVARAYIRYRYKQEVARERKKDILNAVRIKLRGEKNEKQNANMDEDSFGGRTGEATSVITKPLALEDLISETARNNHNWNRIYIHDLDNYYVGCHNCLSIPFDDLLANGFNTRQTDVRPAGSVNTAFQLVAVIFQLQSLQQFGGVSATHLDWTMVPYVRKSFAKYFLDGLVYIENFKKEDFPNYKDWAKIPLSDYNTWTDYGCDDKAYQYAMDMTKKEIHQAVEGLYHNLNTLQSRSGNQLPFTSINYGTCTLLEGRMVIEELLNVSIEGLGSKKKTSIFPCGIFQLGKGTNRKPGDPNYDMYRLALKSTAQRLYPNYANIDWSGNAGYDPNDPTTYFSTMGCRTANGWDINGFGQKKDGRGNICPVTIILPTLAMEAQKEVSCRDYHDARDTFYEFTKILEKAIEDAKDALIDRFEYICSQPPKSAKFMYENGLMAGYVPEEGIRSALKHGTLAIGQLGLSEALRIIFGDDHTNPEIMEYAKEVEQLFKNKCAEYKEQYKLNFGVYYTPAENLCYTAMKKFKEQYGEIENISDRDYFTNSMHVPVWKQMSPFEKIDIESQLTGYSSAGCITYIELDSSVKNNLDALETIVNYAMDHDIPYFAVNVPNDQCAECGYIDEINEACPVCGCTDIKRLRRVTGYLTGDYKSAFNLGKQAEVKDRVRHK